MDCRIHCTYSNRPDKNTCKICQKIFKMEGSCCLDLCGEHDRCRGCKKGTRSERFKEWRDKNGKYTKYLCDKTINRTSKF